MNSRAEGRRSHRTGISLGGGPRRNCSGKIVAAEGRVEQVCGARNVRNARSGRRCTDALRADEGAEYRERKLRVAEFNRLIEPIGKLALARQRTVPFAFVV